MALNIFERFATSENMTVQQISSLVAADGTGDNLYIVLDKFAMHLAYQESSKGTLLAKISVSSYFGNVKNHLLELFPALTSISTRRLQKIGAILDKYCAKRGTDFTHHAPPCTKVDLRTLITAIYSGATTTDDFKDASLLSLLWYLLGRSSDTTCLLKSQNAVYPGGCICIHFKRMKSASYHGASLFYDLGDYITCTVHALPVVSVMRKFPSKFLLDQLPRDTQPAVNPPVATSPLVELVEARLQAPPTLAAGADISASKATPNKIAVPGMQAYVGECSKSDHQLTPGLPSHFFWRGAAQNANGNSKPNTPWIMDRGGWSMTSISKAFNYIVSTSQEDQQVSKVLAGWDAESKPSLPTLRLFDPVVSEKIKQLQHLLFAQLSASPPNSALEMMCSNSRALNHIRVTDTELGNWALTIQLDLLKRKKHLEPHCEQAPTAPSFDNLLEKQTQLIQRQLRVIDTLTHQVDALNERVASLEGFDMPRRATQAPVTSLGENLQESAPPTLQKQLRERAKTLASAWYSWFCDQGTVKQQNKRRYHDANEVAVAFMKIFLPTPPARK
ncbi:hypothetical protein PHMEG_00017284 [Phytophthora megakarya]|uniref:Uncharacterized protein n=1 Tax=Phytophthora megakarya TaxID=4795 RepID=A0A225VXR3_9STRA|nr:hypothetical protein PHMEG_00017284 [Phytophthora megakarya]